MQGIRVDTNDSVYIELFPKKPVFANNAAPGVYTPQQLKSLVKNFSCDPIGSKIKFGKF